MAWSVAAATVTFCGRAPHSRLGEAKAALDRFAETAPGVLVEDKELAVTMHYRLAPLAAPVALAHARRLAADLGLSLQTTAAYGLNDVPDVLNWLAQGFESVRL